MQRRGAVASLARELVRMDTIMSRELRQDTHEDEVARFRYAWYDHDRVFKNRLAPSFFLKLWVSVQEVLYNIGFGGLPMPPAQ